MEKFDYQIVTDTNQWVGGGIKATKDEIRNEVEQIKNRLKEENEGASEIIVFLANNMKTNVYSL
jgi:hypothetical protein